MGGQNACVSQLVPPVVGHIIVITHKIGQMTLLFITSSGPSLSTVPLVIIRHISYSEAENFDVFANNWYLETKAFILFMIAACLLVIIFQCQDQLVQIVEQL